jgi:hypothetical protein
MRQIDSLLVGVRDGSKNGCVFVVGDGKLTATNPITIEVITEARAVERLFVT